jgi:hypothetical protein
MMVSASLVAFLEEAARRANWDAQRGPQHLRSGRFFISEVFAPHAWREPLAGYPRTFGVVRGRSPHEHS